MRRLILSFDHASITGYSVFEIREKGIKLIDKGFLKELTGKNLAEIYDIMYPLFREYAKEIEMVVIEKVNLRGSTFNGNAVIRLAEIRSIIKLLAYEHEKYKSRKDLEVFEVNPLSMKKFVTENGSASKMEVAETVCHIFNLQVTKEVPKILTKKPHFDVTDSIGLGYYAICQVYGKGEHINAII